jgi:hypothetical protein
MIISFGPFEKRRVAPCIPAIPQLPLKCEGRGVRYGATDTPLWLEAAVWLEGRSGRLAGGKSSPAAKRTSAEADTATERQYERQYSPRRLRLGVWRLLSMLIFGQVAGQARLRWRSSKTPPLGFSSHPKSASARPRPHFTSSTYTATISSLSTAAVPSMAWRVLPARHLPPRGHLILSPHVRYHIPSSGHTIYPSSTSPPQASDISSRGWSVAPGSKSHNMKIGEGIPG